MIEFINDPLPIICEIVRGLKPDIDCIVQYNPNIEGEGCTTFPEDGTLILVEINANIPFYAVAEILAHELSHVIVGVNEGHSRKWERVFEYIHKEYEKRITKRERERE